MKVESSLQERFYRVHRNKTDQSFSSDVDGNQIEKKSKQFLVPTNVLLLHQEIDPCEIDHQVMCRLLTNSTENKEK